MCRLDAARNGVRADESVPSIDKVDKNVSKWPADLLQAVRVPVGPSQQRQELGEHHPRRPPDLLAARAKGGNRERQPLPLARHGDEARVIEQIVYRDLEDAGHFAVSGAPFLPAVDRRHDGMKAKATDPDVDWRQRPQNTRLARREADLFVRFAQRRLFYRFTRLDDAAGQGDLPAMPAQGVGPARQQKVCPLEDRKDEEQAGRVTDAAAIRHLSRWGRQYGLRCGPRKRMAKPLGKLRGEIGKGRRLHYRLGTTVMRLQLSCGAG
jgi:hypothetical protein